MPFTLADVVPWGRSFDEYVVVATAPRHSTPSRLSAAIAWYPSIPSTNSPPRAAIRRFLEDFPAGLETGRYVQGSLPMLM